MVRLIGINRPHIISLLTKKTLWVCKLHFPIGGEDHHPSKTPKLDSESDIWGIFAGFNITLGLFMQGVCRQRSLVGYSPWGHKRSDITEHTHTHTHTRTHHTHTHTMQGVCLPVLPMENQCILNLRPCLRVLLLPMTLEVLLQGRISPCPLPGLRTVAGHVSPWVLLQVLQFLDHEWIWTLFIYIEQF